MKKRMIAIALCLVMVSAFAVTSAASAAQAGQSNVLKFDVKSGDGTVYGHMTVVVNPDGTGTFTLNSNGQQWGGHDGKELWKEYWSGHTWGIFGQDPSGASTTLAYPATITNEGGTEHGEGTLSVAATTWLIEHPDAWVYT